MERFEKDFNRWLVIDFAEKHNDAPYSFINNFEKLPFSMQWGVYIDFFDEVDTTTRIRMLGKIYKGDIKYFFDFRGNMQMFETINEARKAALEKAIEIYNQNT